MEIKPTPVRYSIKTLVPGIRWVLRNNGAILQEKWSVVDYEVADSEKRRTAIRIEWQDVKTEPEETTP